MKHITMAKKSLLVGDDAGNALVEYAAVIAQMGTGDAISLNAIGVDGEEVSATFLLNSGTVLIAETSRSKLPEPDNAEQVAYMRGRIQAFGGLGTDTLDGTHPFAGS